MARKTNIDRVLEHLETHEGITSREAFELYGNTRLSASIFCLKKKGYNIISVEKKSENRYGDMTHYVQYQLLKGGEN